MKNITRYDGGQGPKKGFCGWRLCLTRRKEVFVRYFTDKEYGSDKLSLEAALKMRAEMLEELAAGAKSPAEIFAAHRKVKGN
ncbi:MAG: hypothetical protein MJ051_05500 [Akkermansia sp.]|nr:hypothetical protein [Akkermansia sp.]